MSKTVTVYLRGGVPPQKFLDVADDLAAAIQRGFEDQDRNAVIRMLSGPDGETLTLVPIRSVVLMEVSP